MRILTNNHTTSSHIIYNNTNIRIIALLIDTIPTMQLPFYLPGTYS